MGVNKTKIVICTKNLIHNTYSIKIIFYNIDTTIKPFTSEYLKQNVHHNKIVYISIYICANHMYQSLIYKN